MRHAAKPSTFRLYARGTASGRMIGYELFMAHRSRLSTILIDAPADEAAASVSFWSQALGAATASPPGEPQFTGLRGVLPDLVLAVQAVDDAARYHVDIETDDLDAETARLIALGAVEINRWLDCRILRAPGGHLLCVIPLHSDEETFVRLAHTWE
jgi:hypothetical protein